MLGVELRQRHRALEKERETASGNRRPPRDRALPDPSRRRTWWLRPHPCVIMPSLPAAFLSCFASLIAAPLYWLSLPSSHIALTPNNDGVATPVLPAPVFPRSADFGQARYYRGAVPVSGRVRWNVTPVCDREGALLYASAQWSMIHVCTATYTKMVRTFRPGCVRVCAFSGARDGAEPAQGRLSYDVRSRLRAKFGE